MENPESVNQTQTQAVLQQKRQGSPLQQRTAKARPTASTHDVTMSDENNIANASTPSTANTGETNNKPISNQHFAVFKNLRKLNSKGITAKHHLEFLQSLKEKNLVPKGLQVKPVNIGLELPSDLYEKWENSHIRLANDRRDILISYWERHLAQLEQTILEAQARLTSTATTEELAYIVTALDKTKKSKADELKERRQRKQQNALTATSEGGPSQQV